uniref:HEPN domain-containing protein n=1 Tax=Candidatus Methanogaster sp. ANME-2c ERB4 TaxID=2759911 RepID=A0A7G9YN62_9EURY|nr:hypothetical protein OCBBGKCP_00003 [Methanosarcinales archaeon ANME-2c ERB4]
MYYCGIYMTFDWSEYLKLAQELAGDDVSSPGEEAKLRSSVSRAYYAAFCKARNHLRDIDEHKKILSEIPPKVNVHIYVRNQFKNNTDESYKKIGGDLDRLRLFRNAADYDDFVSGLESTTVMSLKLTRSVISTLNTL